MQTIGPIRYPALIATGLRDYLQNSQPIEVSIYPSDRESRTYRRGNRGSQAELGIFERTEREQSKFSLQWREQNTSIKGRHSSGQDI